jgi:hypothetical protein
LDQWSDGQNLRQAKDTDKDVQNRYQKFKASVAKKLDMLKEQDVESWEQLVSAIQHVPLDQNMYISLNELCGVGII